MLTPVGELIFCRILEFDQPELSLKREYLVKGFEDKDVQAYYRYGIKSPGTHLIPGLKQVPSAAAAALFSTEHIS